MNKKKLVIAFSTSSFGLIIILLFVILALFSSAFSSNTNSINAESKTIDMHIISQLKSLNNNVPTKYLYGMEAVLNEGDWSYDDVYELRLSEDDLVCIYNEEDNEILYDSEDEDTYDAFYDCMNYSTSDIHMFEFSVKFFEEFGVEDDNAIFLGNFIRPTNKGTITNEFGGYDALGTGHTGIDIANERNTPIYPSADGKVIRVSSSTEGGNSVSILHNIDGIDYVTYYGHLDQPSNVSEGDEVTVSTQIGKMGETGLATGVHLHFEIMVDTKVVDHSKAVNPREYIDFPELNGTYNDRGELGGDISAEKKAVMKAGGVAEEDYSYADYIISHESSWNFLAVNASSGAYGLCQALPADKLAEAGEDWKLNPITQMKWCNGYAEQRYGGWKQAQSFWQANQWW